MNIQNRSRQILAHGLFLFLAGLVWGLVVPHTPFPRLALAAHIQFTSSGLLWLVAAALLLLLPHQLGPKAAGVIVLAAWLNWVMALSEVANSWWGTTQMLPIAAFQAGAHGGQPWQEAVIKLTHISAGLALIAAWTLLTIGLIKGGGDRANAQV